MPGLEADHELRLGEIVVAELLRSMSRQIDVEQPRRLQRLCEWWHRSDVEHSARDDPHREPLQFPSQDRGSDRAPESVRRAYECDRERRGSSGGGIHRCKPRDTSLRRLGPSDARIYDSNFLLP